MRKTLTSLIDGSCACSTTAQNLASDPISNTILVSNVMKMPLIKKSAQSKDNKSMAMALYFEKNQVIKIKVPNTVQGMLHFLKLSLIPFPKDHSPEGWKGKSVPRRNQIF